MKRVVAVTVLIVLSGCLGTAATTSTQNGTGSLSAQTVNTTALEQKIHEEVNEERTKRGLQSLDWDDELRTVAAYHSEDMLTQDYFAHESPKGKDFSDRYDKFGISCTVKNGNKIYHGGENLAYTYAAGEVMQPTEAVNYDYNESKIATGIVSMWLNSEGHRETMLEPVYQSEGIGVAYNETSKKVYVTQNVC